MTESELAERLDRIETLLSTIIEQDSVKESYTTAEVATILGRGHSQFVNGVVKEGYGRKNEKADAEEAKNG